MGRSIFLFDSLNISDSYFFDLELWPEDEFFYFYRDFYFLTSSNKSVYKFDDIKKASLHAMMQNYFNFFEKNKKVFLFFLILSFLFSRSKIFAH